eukprot:5931565-Pyramimonas_sp.AAC.1
MEVDLIARPPSGEHGAVGAVMSPYAARWLAPVIVAILQRGAPRRPRRRRTLGPPAQRAWASNGAQKRNET